MALTFPASPVDNEQYLDSNGVVWIYSSAKNVWTKLRSDTLKEFSGVKIEINGPKTLTSILSSIGFDTTVFDTGTYYDNSNEPEKIRIRRTGYYRLNILISTGTQGNGASYTFSVIKNGSTILVSDNAGPNQFIYYDELFLLYDGDYIELHGAETGAVGTITTISYIEVERLGFSMGSSFSASSAFSGVKLQLTTPESMTSTPTAIDWDTTIFNVNADINGNLYWSPSDASKITIYTTGYYRVKTFLKSSNLGASDSYTLDLIIDGTTSIESGSIGPNDTLELDETYNFTSGSYLEIFADNSGAVGSITTDSYFQLVRVGV